MVQVRSRLVPVAAMLALALMIAGGGRVAAQDATPVSGAAPAGIPNHIHTGTCANLGDVVAPLANLQYTNMGMAAGTPMASPMAGMATPMAGMATPMAGMAGGAVVPVAVATTRVSMALSDILGAPHAINLHDPAAPADPSRYLACGDIGGAPDPQGNLFVGLQEQNGSGYSGVAWLQDDGSGNGTIVTVFLANSAGSAGMMASPTA
jgi:hypothetical protein